MSACRVPFSVVVATILGSASRGECARMLVSTFVTATWKEPQFGKSCFHSRLHPDKAYSSLGEAKAACVEQASLCGAVYDYHGKGEQWYLCKKGKKFTESKTRTSSVTEMDDADAGSETVNQVTEEDSVIEPVHTHAEEQVHDETHKIHEPQVIEAPVGDDSVLAEWQDEEMGVAFSMVSERAWVHTRWGIQKEPPTQWNSQLQSFISIMTHKTPMHVYKNRAYGLLLHITPSSDFWKYFQVISGGEKEKVGHIEGGPGDGGSHTTPAHRALLDPAEQDYEWFTNEKNAILADYNTVYHTSDYNEFIVNGLSAKSIAGILHYTKGNEGKGISDKTFCNFLCWRAGIGSWPIYSYNKRELKVERHLECVPDSKYDKEYGCNQ